MSDFDYEVKNDISALILEYDLLASTNILEDATEHSSSAHEISDVDYEVENDISALIMQFEEPLPKVGCSSLSRTNVDKGEGGFCFQATTSLGKRRRQIIISDTEDATGPTPGLALKRARTTAQDQSDSSPYYLIAYCPKVQKWIDTLNLSQGVLYELARLVTTGRVHNQDITYQKLSELQGTNDSAIPKITKLFAKASSTDSDSLSEAKRKQFAAEIAANSPWKELDREEAALARGPYEGLGNNPAEPGWYGGKIEFRARLRLAENTLAKKSNYELVLEVCALGPSSRFKRRFGSWSFIRVKIPQSMFHASDSSLDSFFQKQFVIWGRIYRAVYAKNDNIFLYWTNEKYLSGPAYKDRLSFEEFISWHNPIETNSRQLMTKWAARTTLGFSNSVPGPQIQQEFLQEEKDITSEEGSDMTDGCGLATRSIHYALLQQLSLLMLPSAFQFRVAGCKGMLMLHEDAEESFRDSQHRAWVRTSQIKIRYPENKPLDPAMLTFDILRTSRLTTPSKLSSEIIINLAENGVPHSVFIDLLKASIRELFDGLITWEGPDAMYILWSNVERGGGVIAGRRAREAVGEARVRGYTNRSPEDIELEDDNDEDGLDSDLASKSVAWWPDQISGCPSTLEDTVMTLLDSGFCPQDCPILKEKLKQVVVSKINMRTKNLRFEVKQSCIAFAVPDPFSVLGPEEIQIKSSRRNLEGQDGLLTDIILGEVLIARNPCKAPSDIRKVKAVEHPLLRNYVDVIVFSVQGHRRLIDFLAGGDYDGDTALVIWEMLCVLHFKNADEKYSLDPPGLDSAFTRDVEKGESFLQRTKEYDPDAKIQAMQKYLLGALVDPSLVGKYSVMHTNAIYHLGYSHTQTHYLGAKFVRVLDSHKTGYRIKPEIVKADLKKHYHAKGPQWTAASKEKKYKTKGVDTTNSGYLKRSAPLSKKKFVMDVLYEAASQERDILMARVDDIFSSGRSRPDPDLIAPWDNAVAWAARGVNKGDPPNLKQISLEKITAHVHAVYERVQTKKPLAKENSFSTSIKAANFTNLPIEVRQDELRALSSLFNSAPLLEDVPDIPDQATLNRFRASYAYKYDAAKKGGGWSRFPWNVACRELCAIKAAAVGPHKVVANGFYERFKVVNPR